MQPIEAKRTKYAEPITIVCKFWKSLPPEIVKQYADIDAEWKKQTITSTAYQQYCTWKKICGIYKMRGKVCLNCMYVRQLVEIDKKKYMQSFDGKEKIPY